MRTVLPSNHFTRMCDKRIQSEVNENETAPEEISGERCLWHLQILKNLLVIQESDPPIQIPDDRKY